MGKMKEEQREFKQHEGNVITYLQQSSVSSLSISSSDEDELNERSGQGKQRGDLSRRVHEMRDLRGQVMKWVEADGHADRPKHRYFSGRERAASTSEIPSSQRPEATRAVTTNPNHEAPRQLVT
jgi:hypothetical protein